MEKKRFENLDALRFFAFFGVLIYHSGYLFQPLLSKENRILNVVFSTLIEQGKNGVSFFFVLSGFLITYLLLSEKRDTGTISIRNFYIRRILRIFPLYYLVIIVGFFLLPLLIRSYLGCEYLLNERIGWYLAFLPNFDQLRISLSNLSSNKVLSVLWSLGVEEQFYIIWPLVIYFIKDRALPYILGILFILSLLFKVIYINEHVVLMTNTFSVISDMILGAALAYVAINHANLINSIRKAPRLTIVLSYLFFILVLFVNQRFKHVENLRIFLPLCWVFIILEQNYFDNSFVKVSRFKVLNYFGSISYGLYMYHCIALLLVNTFLLRKMEFVYHSPLNSILVLILTFSLTVVISMVSYTYFEKRILKFKNKFESN